MIHKRILNLFINSTTYKIVILSAEEYKGFHKRKLKVKNSFGIRSACVTIDENGEFKFTGNSELEESEIQIIKKRIKERINS